MLKTLENFLCLHIFTWWTINFYVAQRLSSIIRELRDGDWSTALIGSTIFVAVLYGIWLLASKYEGFVQQPNPGWGLGDSLYEPPRLVRPADC